MPEKPENALRSRKVIPILLTTHYSSECSCGKSPAHCMGRSCGVRFEPTETGMKILRQQRRWTIISIDSKSSESAVRRQINAAVCIFHVDIVRGLEPISGK